MQSEYGKFVMTARGKKDDGGDSAKRSALLKVVMSPISGDAGKALAECVAKKDLEGFKKLWGEATAKIVAKLEENFKSSKKD